MNERNARINSTQLGFEHGSLTAMLNLDLGGSCQGFGGYSLEHGNYCTRFVKRLLTTVGVDRWEDLVGKYVRVRSRGCLGEIIAVGHVIEDKWFVVAELASEPEYAE